MTLDYRGEQTPEFMKQSPGPSFRSSGVLQKVMTSSFHYSHLIVLQGGKFTSKSDVWSFGVTIWEIFSYGAAPYQWMTNKEAWERIPNGERLEKPTGCPDFIYKLYLKCCSMNPADRPTFAQVRWDKMVDE